MSTISQFSGKLSGIDPNQVNEGKGYNLVDPIFKSHEGGCIYVGGERAARDLDLLREKKINTVVNCTNDIRLEHLPFRS